MKVLLFELNDFHYEVLPGFAYYLIHLGYDVDCFMQDDNRLGDVFAACPLLKEKIHFYYYKNDEKCNVLENMLRQNMYDLLFANSFDYYDSGNWVSIFKKFSSLDNNRLCIVGCVHWPALFLDDFKKDIIPANRTFTLTKTDFGGYSFPEVNLNYFCDHICRKLKNQSTHIVSIGRSADRLTLWHAIKKAARKETKYHVCLVCIGKSRPIKAKIIFYVLSIIETVFHVTTRPSARNLPPLFAKLFGKRTFKDVISPTFQDMFKEIQESDFLDASILKEYREDFKFNRTSGIKQLSLGFLKPCIIEKSIADYYGFTEKSAVIYEEGKMDEAVMRAVSMTKEEYSNMVDELEKLCNEIRDRSERNLQNIISKIETKIH